MHSLIKSSLAVFLDVIYIHNCKNGKALPYLLCIIRSRIWTQLSRSPQVFMSLATLDSDAI